MAYANRYKILFKNVQEDTITIYILEKDYAGSEVIELEAGGDPLTIEYQSGDTDVMSPVRGSLARIQYWNKGGYPLTTFASTADDKYKIEVYVDSVVGGNQLYWTGFLVQDDCNEPFLPAPNVVSLQATDNLALLKDVALDTAMGGATFSKLALTSYFQSCLDQTGLELETDIYCNVFENSHLDRSDDPNYEPFSQTKVSTKTFIKSSTEWDDCYTVLEKILDAWKCTLFQANGRWIIIRWPELKSFSNFIPGTRYSSTWLNPQQITLSGLKTIGKGYPIYPVNASAVKSIVRPNKHTKLTFNYEQPYQLVLNSDFSILGALIRSYASGSDTVYEYEATYWSESVTQYPAGASMEGFIRVIRNQYGVETGRYMVIKNDVGSMVSTTFEANAGDKINISFRFKTSDSQAGNVTSVFVFKLTDGVDTYYLDEDGTWDLTVGASFITPSGDNTNNWQTVSFESNSMPISGDFSVFLHQCDLSAPYNETLYSDLSIEYVYAVNDQTNVIGHIHKSVQNETVKNTYEKTIFVDDSPKNNLRGAMFLDDGTTKTSLWHRGTTSEELQFGYIQKTDLLFITDSFRKKIEGDFNNLRDNSSYLFTLLNVFEFSAISGSYFILGPVRFNMKAAMFSGVLEEVWNSAEVYDDTVYTNTFTYIYRT